MTKKYNGYQGHAGALQMIVDIGLDYDGLCKPESLMNLIDEIVDLARQALIQGDEFDALKHYECEE